MTDVTRKNMQEAFSGESQANRRYLAFAVKAAEEHFPNMARLFRAVVKSETIHAVNHLKALGGIRSMVEGAPPDKCPICGQGKDKFLPAE